LSFIGFWIFLAVFIASMIVVVGYLS
jgi:hypothetical protein